MSTFDQLLGKLAEMVGGERAPANAMAAAQVVANPVGTIVQSAGNALVRGARNEMSGVEAQDRGAQMPIANWPDGPGLAVPQTLIDAKNAFARFHRGEAPQPEDAVLAGLAMTGAGAFGLGRSAVSRGSVAGAERAEASSGLPSHSGPAKPTGKTIEELNALINDPNGPYPQKPWTDADEAWVRSGMRSRDDTLHANPPEAAPVGFIPTIAGAERQPFTARVYRGASNHEQWPPTNPRHNEFWASDNPEVASSYASEAIRHGGDMGSVTPADVTFQNPMVVNASGKRWDQWNSDGQFSSNELVRQARNAGHDGLIIQQVQDGLNGVVPSATTYAALKPGTVKSATTGETLFSNPKDAAPAGLLATGEGEHHSRQQARNPSGQFVTSDSFDGKLHAFNKVLVDLDGDGKPDAVVEQPSNAFANFKKAGR
jgi:hypothetical protein